MKRPIKICKNPECEKEFDSYKSSKKKHCCESCRQRANYLKRTERYKGLKKIEEEYKQQYKLITFLDENAKGQISLNLLDQFKFDPKFYTKGTDIHGRPVYEIQDKSVSIDPENPKFIFIKKIIKLKSIKLTASQHFMSSSELVENLKTNFKSDIPVQKIEVNKSATKSIGQIITIGISIVIISYQLIEMYKRVEGDANNDSPKV